MKKKLSKLLRAWADKLYTEPRPFRVPIHETKLTRYAIDYAVSDYEYNARLRRFNGHPAKDRLDDILKQEAIVRNAIGLSNAVNVTHERGEILVKAEFYIKEE